MATTVEVSDTTWRKLNSRKMMAGESFDDVIRRLLHETDEVEEEGVTLFKHASVVQLTEPDPRNGHSEGQVQIVAGKHGNVYEYSVVDEENGDFRDIKCEVLTVLEAPYRMPKDEITSWAADQERAVEAAQEATA